MADEDEILRFAQDDTGKQLRRMCITVDMHSNTISARPFGIRYGT